MFFDLRRGDKDLLTKSEIGASAASFIGVVRPCAKSGDASRQSKGSTISHSSAGNPVHISVQSTCIYYLLLF